MPPISIYPHYLQLTEEEEQVLQDCIKHTNAGIKRTVILALKNYQKQLISSLETKQSTDELVEIKNLLHDLSSHLEENNCLIKRVIEA